jgi:hypothetical protein
MNRRYHRCKRWCTWYTAWRNLSLHTQSDEPTVRFLVAPDEFKRKSSEDGSTGWSDRFEWGHSQCIRRLVQIRAKTRQDKYFSTGWTDALVKGKSRSIRRLWRNQQRQFGEKSFSTGWTNAPSVHSVRAVLTEHFKGYMMWEGHRMNWCSWKVGVSSSDRQLFSEPLANG